ncbi:hypothetical protein LRAMOSA01060 [Lichtheimia ramosa]|uniref:Uncharacterized protein n=1 Tax=Lichtheimia ramosa TaxID=688394 RepID=A0A077WBX1_9FUNG|nr:hypothetical protein LRAMOSA01060 [Lichtheimia ramosa]
MSMPFTIPRFAGSTLEPSSEPIIIYPEHMLRKETEFHTQVMIVPTRCTPPLNRRNKPAHIIIPPYERVSLQDDDTYSPWSYDSTTNSTSDQESFPPFP